MSEGKVKKRSSKKYFIKKSFSNKRSIELGAKGFLCSCNNREKDCVKETYNILNQYADKIYGSTTNSIVENDDITQSLDDELKSLKTHKTDNRFQLIESGAKNLLFIKTELSNPVELARAIVEDIHETKVQQTRHLLRLVPIETVCKANVDDIVKHFEILAGKHFTDDPKNFAVSFNHRNNNVVNRDEVIKRVAEKVAEIRKDHKVDLKNAQISIIIEVIKSFAFLSIVPDYIKYKKYNLLSCSGVGNEPETTV